MILRSYGLHPRCVGGLIMVDIDSSSLLSDEAIVRSHLLGFESDEHYWRGYVKTDQELEHLERALLGLGVSFKVTSSRKHAEENLNKAGKCKYISVNS